MIKQEKVIPSVISIHEKWCIACHSNDVTAKKIREKEKKSQTVLNVLSFIYLAIHFLQEIVGTNKSSHSQNFLM